MKKFSFREVDRILKDDGEIILISFNMYSLLFVFKFLAIKSFLWKKKIKFNGSILYLTID